MIAERKGKYHADPIFSELSILKIEDMYRQQLRIHAWLFMKGRLPESQAAMLSRVSDIHSHNTRSAGSGLFLSSQDQRSIGYRIPKEWDTLPEELREMTSIYGFKKKSKNSFIADYRLFSCGVPGCYVCTDL